MSADGGHISYPVDAAAVRSLAQQMCHSAGDTEGDFVFIRITVGEDGTTARPRACVVENGPQAVDEIVQRVTILAAELRTNVYFAGALFKPGSVDEHGVGRSEGNVVGVIVAVTDLDAHKNAPATRYERLPCEPTSEAETSPGSFQAHYWFDRPYLVAEIKPTLIALAAVTGADDCKSAEHLWRVPGTGNTPDARKMKKRQCSADTVPSRWITEPEGWYLISAEDLRAAILKKDPAAFECVRSSNGGDFDWNQRWRPSKPRRSIGAKSQAKIDEAFATGEGGRSEALFSIIGTLKGLNWMPQEILEFMLEHESEEAMDHYGDKLDENRLRADIVRNFEKSTAPRHDYGFTAYSETDASAPLRTIRIQGGALPANVDEAEAALLEQGAPIYQRGSFLVRRGKVVIERRDGESVKEDLIVPLTQPALIEMMTSAAQFERWDARMMDWKRIDCPKGIADAYLARTGLWKLRALMGVTRTPILRSDGTILDTPGYDSSTGFIYDPRGIAFPSISAEPSRDDARAALDTFNELIGKFPFASPEARAVALAALLTSCVRPTLPFAPLFGIDGTGQGSGKGLLVDTTSIVGSGSPAASITTGADGAELEKRIGSLLLSGAPSLSIDNVTKPLESDFLAMLLTQPAPMMRILGQSKVVPVPANAMLFATGNGLTCGSDMWRRVLVCLIDPLMERPSTRTFDFNPAERALRDRPRYVSAALTVLRAYHVAGAPAQDGLPMGSFTEWCRRVRDPLLWLGEADPVITCVPPADDPERDRFAAVILGWQAVIGEVPMTLKQAIGAAVKAATEQASSEFLEALHAVAAPMVRGGDTKIDARRLGEWLRGKKRQVLRGLRLVPHGVTDGVARWRLEKVSGRTP